MALEKPESQGREGVVTGRKNNPWFPVARLRIDLYDFGPGSIPGLVLVFGFCPLESNGLEVRPVLRSDWE